MTAASNWRRHWRKRLTAPDAPRLPAKFGFAIDCGPQPVLTDVSADIRLERSADGGLICRADGAAKAARVSPATAVGTMLALADWFVQSGGITGERGRMAAHLARGAALPEYLYGSLCTIGRRRIPRNRARSRKACWSVSNSARCRPNCSMRCQPSARCA